MGFLLARFGAPGKVSMGGNSHTPTAARSVCCALLLPRELRTFTLQNLCFPGSCKEAAGE